MRQLWLCDKQTVEVLWSPRWSENQHSLPFSVTELKSCFQDISSFVSARCPCKIYFALRACRVESWWLSCRDIPGDKLNAQCRGDYAQIFPASCVCFLFPFPTAECHTTEAVSWWESKNSNRRKVREILSPLSSFLEVVLVGFAAPSNCLKLKKKKPSRFSYKNAKKIGIVSFSVKCHVKDISLN